MQTQKKNELKELVSSRYHDLIESADAIVGMTDTVTDFQNIVHDIKGSSKDLFVKRLNFINSANATIDFEETKELEQPLEQDELSKANHIMQVPTLLWTALDNNATWHAASFYLASEKLRNDVETTIESKSQPISDMKAPMFDIDQGLMSSLSDIAMLAQNNQQQKTRNESSIWIKFPLLRSQCNLIQQFRDRIIDQSNQNLAAIAEDTYTTAASLAAISLLQNNNTEELFELLIQSRSKAIQNAINTANAEIVTILEHEKEFKKNIFVVDEADVVMDDDNNTEQTANEFQDAIASKYATTISLVLKVVLRTVFDAFAIFMSQEPTPALIFRLLDIHGEAKNQELPPPPLINIGVAKIEASCLTELCTQLQTQVASTLEERSSLNETVSKRMSNWVQAETKITKGFITPVIGNLMSIGLLAKIQENLQQHEISFHSDCVYSIDHSKIANVSSNSIQPAQFASTYFKFSSQVLQQSLDTSNMGTDSWFEQVFDNLNDANSCIFNSIFHEEFINRTAELLSHSLDEARDACKSKIDTKLVDLGNEADGKLKRAMGLVKKRLLQLQPMVQDDQPVEFSSFCTAHELFETFVQPSLPIRTAEKKALAAMEIIQDLEIKVQNIVKEAYGVNKAKNCETIDMELSNAIGTRCNESMREIVSWFANLKLMQIQDEEKVESTAKSALESMLFQVERLIAKSIEQEQRLLLARIGEALTSSQVLMNVVGKELWQSEQGMDKLCEQIDSIYERWCTSVLNTQFPLLVEKIHSEPWSGTTKYWHDTHSAWHKHLVSEDDGEDEEIMIPSTVSSYLSGLIFKLCEAVLKMGDEQFTNKLRLKRHNQLKTESKDLMLSQFESYSRKAIGMLLSNCTSEIVKVYQNIFNGEQTHCEAGALQAIYDIKWLVVEMKPSVSSDQLNPLNKLVTSIVDENVDPLLWCLYDSSLTDSIQMSKSSSILLTGPIWINSQNIEVDKRVAAKDKQANANLLPMCPSIPIINTLPVSTPFKTLSRLRSTRSMVSRTGSGRNLVNKSKDMRRHGSSNTSADVSMDTKIREKAYAAMESVTGNTFLSGWLQQKSTS